MGTRRGRAMATETENEGDCCGYKRSCGVLARVGISAFGEMPLCGKRGRRDKTRR